MARMPTFDEFMAHGRAVEDRLRSAQRDLSAAVVVGRSADGAVTVVANGMGRVHAVRVDPRILAEPDVTRLQAAIVEAIHAAGTNAARLAREHMGAIEVNPH
ncbi:hypothetical protein Val02_72280 [Virgisporangium aliadipatigenens]|uniref:Nucleoid-associated protein n=1 Tax=Virgisporangium aliadipatigenens TaxID=741659 RepID=A0A8J3YTH5_9ACTN|nr:YbaB/EbfC family nucleoid-associated protein [Virgisporangium aliadipatigenens]GIJ50342.1 hypothetical protein Val02_72280 [Virgisporangium aliadipatigenens]